MPYDSKYEFVNFFFFYFMGFIKKNKQNCLCYFWQKEQQARFCAASIQFLSLWVSGTIINSRIFCLQAVHLQIHLLSVVVSGDGKSALNWLRIGCFTAIISDISNPLKPFSFCLFYPLHAVVTESISRGCTGQFMGLTWPFYDRLWLSQSLTRNTWK